MDWVRGRCLLLIALLSRIIQCTGQGGSDLNTFLDEVEGFVYQLKEAALGSHEHACGTNLLCPACFPTADYCVCKEWLHDGLMVSCLRVSSAENAQVQRTVPSRPALPRTSTSRNTSVSPSSTTRDAAVWTDLCAKLVS